MCGKNNNSGFYKAGSFSVRRGATSTQFIIALNQQPRPIGLLVAGYFNNDKLCKAQYQAGVITATCNAPRTLNTGSALDPLLTACNTACSGATSDKSGREFVTCLQNASCISAGITANTDINDYATSNISSIPGIASYSNLNAGVTIFANVNTCHAAIVGRPTSYGTYESAYVCFYTLLDINFSYEETSYSSGTQCTNVVSLTNNSSNQTNLHWLDSCRTNLVGYNWYIHPL